MPHKCVRCGKIFSNTSKELLSGCECGSRVFIFLRGDKAPDELSEQSPEAVKNFSWLENELSFLARDKPVSVDVDSVENLRIIERGSYELDLASLMKGDPLVVKSDHGVYYIKIPSLKKE